MILTDETGMFRHGPVEKDNYEVGVMKDGWTFEAVDDLVRFDFFASKIPRLNVKVVDDIGQAISDVRINIINDQMLSTALDGTASLEGDIGDVSSIDKIGYEFLISEQFEEEIVYVGTKNKFSVFGHVYDLSIDRKYF